MHPNVSMILLALVMSYIGMTSLCLSMQHNYKKIWSKELTKEKRYLFKLIGWTLLAIALAACIAGWGSVIGIIAWLGFLTMGALTVVILLAYIPRIATTFLPLGSCLIAIGLLGSILK